MVDEVHGKPLRLDPGAVSARLDAPAFIARPSGAPVYYGFPILDDVEVDGFRLGMITDWEAEHSESGDAFVVAPDGSRCGLNWEVSAGRRCEEVIPPQPDRWGVWWVAFPHPMESREDARRNLAHVLLDLRRSGPPWSERPA